MAMQPTNRPWHALADSLFAEHRTTAQIIAEVQRAFPEVRRAQIDGRLGWLRGRTKQHAAATAPVTYPVDAPIVSPLSESPITLEQLLALFGIDSAEWEAVEVTPNVWHMGAAHPETGEILTQPLYQLKARLRRRAGPQLAELRDGLLADIRAEATARDRNATRTPLTAESRHMLEVSAFDLHFGKLAWREEAGEDYDLSIARATFETAIHDLVWKARGFPLQRILLPIGNDLLQTDNLAGTTTGGTPQDTDSRYHKAFRAARSALAWAIDRLAEEAPVLVVVVPGNHDRLTAFHMGEVLAAQFARDSRVTVDNSPKLRKYVAFGATLLGFTHGSEEKHNDLPLIMAREEPELWATSTHYEWHIGHFHKSKETRYTAGDSFNGVRVRILPSLCAADAWHYSKGYVGERRSAEAYLWNFATGYAGHLATSVLAAPRAA
jgi:hypothetical protein